MKILIILIFISSGVAAKDIKDIRFCGEPERTAAGEIKRSKTVINQFKKLYPCPSTGKSTGACPGWAVDHVIPLAVGGCDSTPNLQWLPDKIKSCADDECKDRWEREIYKRIN